MADLATELRRLATDMDLEYERSVAAQKRVIRREGVRSRAFHQLDGRMDVLAQWASQLRCKADRHEKGMP